MKNIVFKTNSSGISYSFKYDKLVAIEHTQLTGGSYVINFLFESDKGNEIYSVNGVIVSDFIGFLRDFYSDLNGAKSDSVVVIDEVTKDHVSNKVALSVLTVTTIASPVLLNGNLNLSVDESGTLLTTPYDVTAGDITAVSNLISDNDISAGGNADIDGNVTVGGDITVGGVLVDNSSPNPTVTTNNAGAVTISGKDSVGVVTCTTACAAGDTITVTYGTSSANTRIPVLSILSKIDVYLSSFDNNGFTVSVGDVSTPTSELFTYVTKDHA